MAPADSDDPGAGIGADRMDLTALSRSVVASQMGERRILGSVLTFQPFAAPFGDLPADCTLSVAFRLEAGFDAVRLLYANDRPVPCCLTAAQLAPADRLGPGEMPQDKDGGDIPWTEARFPDGSGGTSRSLIVPAAPAAGGVAYAASEWIDLSVSVPEGRPWLVVRSLFASSARGIVLNQTDYLAFQCPDQGAGRHVIAAQQEGDFVSTPIGLPAPQRQGLIAPVAVQYRTSAPGLTVLCVGDSIVCGTGTASHYSGWGLRACAELSRPDRPASYVNAGIRGAPSRQFCPAAAGLLPFLDSGIAFIAAYTVNDQHDAATTRDKTLAGYTIAAGFARAAAGRGLLPVFVAPLPWLGIPDEVETIRRHFVDGLHALDTQGVSCLDFEPAAIDAATGRPRGSFFTDGLHPGDAGTQLMARTARDFLVRTIGDADRKPEIGSAEYTPAELLATGGQTPGRFSRENTLDNHTRCVVPYAFLDGSAMKFNDFYLQSQIQDTARSARLLVAVTFYYRVERLPYLLNVIRTLRDFPVTEVKIVVYTNEISEEDYTAFERLLAYYATERFSCEISRTPDPPYAYGVAWAHRGLIRDRFVPESSQYTHFVYLEDDMRFSYLNFCYFLFFREVLRPRGVLPAFVRVEFNKSRLDYCATDASVLMDYKKAFGVIERKQIAYGRHVFVPLDNAYMAMYILDRELGQEYVASRSFDREKSSEVVDWGVAERAAAGLCREDLPPGYATRYVVPLDAVSRVPAVCSWIYHLPNNYTEREAAENRYGQLSMAGLFIPEKNDQPTVATTPEPGDFPSAWRDGPIPTFSGNALAAIPSFAAFLARLGSADGEDSVLVHAPQTEFVAPKDVLRRGENWFGLADAQAAAAFRTGGYRMRETETVLLHDVIVSPQSTVVCSLARGFYEPSITNLLLNAHSLAGLVRNDKLFQLTASGACVFTEMVHQLPRSDATAIPVCGVGFHNYGHFLYDGLPLAYQTCLSLPAGAAVLVGPELAPWQREILELLGIADRYEAMTFPTRFSRVVASSHLSLHVSYPMRFIRPVFDRLRLVAGSGRKTNRCLFISRSRYSNERLLLNSDEVEALFRDNGFEVVHPERMSVAEQVAVFSEAAVVAGESGAGMANVGFCDPGTRILEIQPESFVEPWTRSACMLFGHDWRVLFARCPDGSQRHPGRRIDYFVDTGDLRAAIAALGTT